jgi:amiloride-sensitive sodium channel
MNCSPVVVPDDLSQVTFHNPAELPTLAHPAAYVHVDHLTMVKITPDVKVTDKVLRKWAPSDRGCFFEDERPLKYFNLYTEKNCDLECETNITLSACGCVPYYVPRKFH